MKKIRTTEKIGKYNNRGARRYLKRALAKARRTNERRAIRDGVAGNLPRTNRAYLCGWGD